MNTFVKFSLIPIVLFAVFFGIPKLVAVLFNMHSDAGLIAIVMLVSGIVGYIASITHHMISTHNKDTTNEG
jgi:hypothetical protein